VTTPAEHRWAWIQSRIPQFSYNAKLLVDEVIRDGSDWSLSETSAQSITLSRMIDRDAGLWPFDKEQVTITVDYIGRFKSCSRTKVINIEQGRSYAAARRMLRLPATPNPYPKLSTGEGSS
jgi:hypothetical protein